MKYLVTGSEGPGYATPEQAIEVLEKGILPTFDALMNLEADKKIVAGGLPVGDRALVFILEAASHEEADQLLRDLPAWGVLKWAVTHSRALRDEPRRNGASSKDSRSNLSERQRPDHLTDHSHCCECLAPNGHSHRRIGDDPRRRSQPLSHAGDPCRCHIHHPEPRQPQAHRQSLHRRGGARRRGHHRSRALCGGARREEFAARSVRRLMSSPSAAS
jgi:hypothetical protein